MIEADEYGGKSWNVISHCPRHTGWVCPSQGHLAKQNVKEENMEEKDLGYIEIITKFKNLYGLKLNYKSSFRNLQSTKYIKW
jgi:hypothetical protein